METRSGRRMNASWPSAVRKRGWLENGCAIIRWNRKRKGARPRTSIADSNRLVAGCQAHSVRPWGYWDNPNLGRTAQPGGKPFPVVQTGAWDRGAHFSRDGKWVVFTSRDSGAGQVYATPFPGPGPKWQVSAHGGDAPRWSADGKWICFWNGAHNVLLKVSVSSGGGRPVFGAETPFINGAVYVSTSYRPDYSLSRDGRALVNRVGEQSARFTIVMNWEAGAGK